MINPEIDKFIKDQLSVWHLASENYRDLKKVQTKSLTAGGMNVVLQYNPNRKISSEARLDQKSISERPCFLCPENRPKEQTHTGFNGRKGRKYRVTLNPYPIFPSHLVISSRSHTPQSIWHRYQDAIDFVKANPDTVCFYNGPKSGASAPDHMHFQACPSGLMPLQVKADSLLVAPAQSQELTYLTSIKEAELYHFNGFANGVFFLKALTPKSLAKLFYRLLDCAPVKEGESEPRFNMLVWKCGREIRSAVVFREKHRSSHYLSGGEDCLHMSPGCADMSGVFVAPEASDFEKMDDRLLAELIKEVCISEEEQNAIIWRLTRTQPVLEVGIMSGSEIRFEILSDGAGLQTATYSEGKVCYNGALYDELLFDAQTESTMFSEPSFVLHDVTIGVGFHWERRLTQKFAGKLKIIVEDGKLTAVDIVGVEDYLLSVISSEMKASASLEFLKAHAVISRSWVMAQIAGRKTKNVQPVALGPNVHDLPSLVTSLDAKLCSGSTVSGDEASNDEYIKWFDHDDHKHFDVCADDHCQRYQGLTMAVGETVRKAIDQTWGLVLKYGDQICDARFSKCCGGMMETFETCWEDQPHPYLQAIPDTPDHDPSGTPFCDTKDEEILSQVLNDYDLETKDFFRWHQEYARKEVSELIKERSGIDFGTIRELVPLDRGESGRIFKMKVVGEKKTMVIGKELIIRKWLSTSHLKSSAFDVKWDGDRLSLSGKGWGHGVGLCQIGAAVMSVRGYAFTQILEHYYPGSRLEAIGNENGQ